jgi:sRNA-binding regulator protein Hfq
MASTAAATPTAPTAPTGAPDTPVPAAPAARAAKRPWPDARVQGAWYERNRDRPVRLRLLDGSELDGVLVGADTYTLALRLPDRAEPVLVNKHAVAVLVRLEAGAAARPADGELAPPSRPPGTRPGGA